MTRGLSKSSFTPRMRAVLGAVMRTAWARERGVVPPERRMRFNPAKPHTVGLVSHLPDCDICKMEGYSPVRKAHYDAKTLMGPWANLCTTHFRQYGIGLGLGKGQKLVVVNPGGGVHETAADYFERQSHNKLLTPKRRREAADRMHVELHWASESRRMGIPNPLVCLKCGRPWPKGMTSPGTCPKCGFSAAIMKNPALGIHKQKYQSSIKSFLEYRRKGYTSGAEDAYRHLVAIRSHLVACGVPEATVRKWDDEIGRKNPGAAWHHNRAQVLKGLRDKSLAREDMKSFEKYDIMGMENEMSEDESKRLGMPNPTRRRKAKGAPLLLIGAIGVGLAMLLSRSK